MTTNQVVLWKAVILLSLIVGVVFSSLWLLNGSVRGPLIGIVFLAFGIGVAVIGRRSRKTSETTQRYE